MIALHEDIRDVFMDIETSLCEVLCVTGLWQVPLNSRDK